jgi:hypothetical protein
MRSSAAWVAALALTTVAPVTRAALPEPAVRLELSPRVCTLAGTESECQAHVRASWRANGEESVCLVLLTHPEVGRCWERLSEGEYTIDLTFRTDLTFELTDLDHRQVVASEVLRVIREAARLRHRRRDPWNLFG